MFFCVGQPRFLRLQGIGLRVEGQGPPRLQLGVPLHPQGLRPGGVPLYPQGLRPTQATG